MEYFSPIKTDLQIFNFDVEQKVQVVQVAQIGGRGGEVIRAMPERKHFSS